MDRKIIQFPVSAAQKQAAERALETADEWQELTLTIPQATAQAPRFLY